jgi:hypothetical protein
VKLRDSTTRRLTLDLPPFIFDLPALKVGDGNSGVGGVK